MVLFLEDISRMIPPRIARLHFNLILCIQKLGMDKHTIILLSSVNRSIQARKREPLPAQLHRNESI